MKPLQVPGRLQSLEEVDRYVQQAAEAARLDRSAAYRLRLAVDELATNVIVHGYQAAGLQGNLDIAATVDDEVLLIAIEDTGPAFNPTEREDPTGLDLPLEERSVGGLGLFLVKRSVDEVRYEREGDRNRVTLVVYRAPASTPN